MNSRMADPISTMPMMSLKPWFLALWRGRLTGVGRKRYTSDAAHDDDDAQMGGRTGQNERNIK